MNKSYKARAAGVISLAALCVGLSGCLAEKSMWSENDTVKRNSVALHHITYDVAFAGDTTGLTDAQAEAINGFLVRSMASYGDTFAIDAGEDELSSSRREALVSFLRARGLVVSAQPAVYGGALGSNSVRLILNRYVVTPPPCPDWRHPVTPDYNNQPSSNFGCATATNLGLMVADPRDLVDGKSIGVTDAENAAKAVQDYREGKVKELESVSTGGSNSSNGSSGNSGGSQ